MARTRQAAIETAQLALDLELRHRPRAAIDLARFDLWVAQVLVDVAADDAAAIKGDLFTLDYIRDRIAPSLDGAALTLLNTQLLGLQRAAGEEDLALVAEAAAALRKTIAGLQPDA